MNTASAIIKWPILNSDIAFILAILDVDLYVSPWPAWTSKLRFFACKADFLILFNSWVFFLPLLIVEGMPVGIQLMGFKNQDEILGKQAQWISKYFIWCKKIISIQH